MDPIHQLIVQSQGKVYRSRSETTSGQPTVPLASLTLGVEELTAAIETLLSGQLTMSDQVRAFETEFAEYVGVRHAVMVNSGSSANLLLVAALANPLNESVSLPKGRREVVIPAVSWSTSVWPWVQHGFVPVFSDIDLETFMPSVTSIETALSADTAAVFTVHLLGGASDTESLGRLCSRAGAILVEDSCESLGTTYRGKMTGSHGVGGTYSFFFSHHITTGEGGMVVSNDDRLADIMKMMRAHGWARDSANRQKWEAENPDLDPRFLFITTGYNLRPTEIAAAIGRVQLRRLHSFNEERRRYAEIALSYISDLESVIIPRVPDDIFHTWYGLPFVLRPGKSARRSAVVAKLSELGIETRPIVAGNMARQPALKSIQHRKVSLPNADLLMENGIYVGVNPGMSDSIAHYLGENLRKVLS